MAVDIKWTDQSAKGGDISVDRYGLSVGTECCGCGSIPLTDVDELIKLYKALGETIHYKTGQRGVLFR